MKRQVLIVLFAALVLVVAACAPKPTPTPTPAPTPTLRPLVTPSPTPIATSVPVKGEGKLIIYGQGISEKEYKGLWIPKFEAKTGCKVTGSYGMSSDVLAKLVASKANPTFDVGHMDTGPTQNAYKLELLAKFDPKIVTEYVNLFPPPIKYPDPVLEWYYAPFKIFGVPIIINRAEFEKRGLPEPKSILDTANPAYKDRLIFNDTSVYQTFETLALIARALGGDEKNLDPALDWVRDKVRPIALAFTGGAEGEKLMGDGSAWVWLGNSTSRPIRLIFDVGVPLKNIVPKEGLVASTTGWSLVKGGPNPICGNLWINYALSKEAADTIGDYFYGSPTRADAYISETAKKAIVLPEDIKRGILLDYAAIEKQRQHVIDRFNREIKR